MTFLASVLEIYNGPDRVTAVMGGALIEDALMKAISASLTDPDDTSALFHDLGAPFGTLRARIVAGKAMGLYDAETVKDLEIIRDVRNQFAHALLSMDFKNEHIERACSELRGYRTHPEHSYRAHIPEARKRFEDACWELQKQLLDKASTLLKGQLSDLKRRRMLSDLISASLESRPNNILGDVDPD